MTNLVLGKGNEGIVYRYGDEVVKVFYDNVLNENHIKRILSLLKKHPEFFPDNFNLKNENGKFVIRYKWFESEAVVKFTESEIFDYLVTQGTSRVIIDNLKYSNLRRVNGRLVNIDFGKHIKFFNRSTFRDLCAKSFCLLNGMTDEKLIHSFEEFRNKGEVENLAGFGDFYKKIVIKIAEKFWEKCPTSKNSEVADDTTLLIKCCAMDYQYIESQVRHIVSQLSTPTQFKEVVLLIDTRTEDFLRQHAAGNFNALRKSAQLLLSEGIIDRIIEPEVDSSIIKRIYLKWFGLACEETHTKLGIPIYSQLYAFNEIHTNYVLQADCDVLICRYDANHNYLSEMREANQSSDVMGVGFNIPHKPTDNFKLYNAPHGEYKPEVRLGLFNLKKFQTTLPWPNLIDEGFLEKSWYQSLHNYLKIKNFMCLRGGDPRTFYIHPLNNIKSNNIYYDLARSCTEFAIIPVEQLYHWDLIDDECAWIKLISFTNVVLIIYPRSSDKTEIQRCIKSIAGQDDKNFSILIIDDNNYEAETIELLKYIQSYRLKYFRVKSHFLNHYRNYKNYLVDEFESLLCVKIKSNEALMTSKVIEDFAQLNSIIGNDIRHCVCNNENLISSSEFGHKNLYSGRIRKLNCNIPRLVRVNDFISLLDICMMGCEELNCMTSDTFSEVPPRGCNDRYPVMGGFLICRNNI